MDDQEKLDKQWRREMRRQLGLDRMLWMPDTLALGYERDDSNA